MTTQDIDPATHNSQLLHESREGVRSLQFFLAAMAAQLRDMTDKLNQVEPVTVGGDSTGASVQLEEARNEIVRLNARIQELERHADTLGQDLERQKVSFADHHAAKQEIARLRDEVESLRAERADDQEKPGQRKRWTRGSS